MESLVNQDAALACAPAWPASDGLNFQPVFSSDGLVCEYTVTLASQRHGWRRGAPGESTRLMRAALGFFQASGERIPFALNYGSPPPPIAWSANEVCELGGVILHRNELRAAPDRLPADRAGLAYPASLVSFHAPLVAHLLARSQMFTGFVEFNVGFRLRLTPTMGRGGPSANGAVQVVGLHMQVPPGVSEHATLRTRFVKLLERADLLRLPVLATNVNQAHDLHWMRIFPDVLLQGDVLCPPLGPDSLKALLALSGDNWRDFRVGGRYPQYD